MGGDVVSPAIQPDFTLTIPGLRHGFDFQFGMRNIFNSRIYDPVALNDFVDVMPRPGREIFLRVMWRTAD